MLSRFRLYSLDNGSLIVVCGKCGFHLVITKELLDETRKHVCGKCGFHLVITKELLDETRKHTVLGEPEKEEITI
jgi:DNA-directed RNA polymerase subunit RPC12/RpoP